MAENNANVVGGNNPVVDFLLWLKNATYGKVESSQISPDQYLSDYQSGASPLRNSAADLYFRLHGGDPNTLEGWQQYAKDLPIAEGDPSAISDAYNQRGPTIFDQLPAAFRNNYPAGWPGQSPNGTSNRELDNYLGNTATFGLLDSMLGEGLGDAQARYLRALSAVNTPPWAGSSENAYHAFNPGLLPVDPNSLFSVKSTPRGRGVDAGSWNAAPFGVLNPDPGMNRRYVGGTPVPNSAGMDWMYPQVTNAHSSPQPNSGFPTPTPSPTPMPPQAFPTPIPVPTQNPNWWANSGR